MQPFGETYERETWEREEAHGDEKRRELLEGTPLNLLCALLLQGAPYIGGRGAGLPLPQGKGAAAKGGKTQP
jgi:hypothetical protein